MLLQSHEGFLRLFPAWPAGEPAGFSTLRAVGALLVSASRGMGADSSDGVGDVRIESEAGRPCVLLSPWDASGARAPVVVAADTGKRVPVTAAGGAKWRFATEPGGTYIVSDASGAA